MKKILLHCLVLLALCFSTKTSAQKYCDLQLTYVNPIANSELPYGDMLWLVCGITNNGPDVINAGDTLFYKWNDRPVIRVTWGDIAVGATFNDTILYGTASEVENDTFDICHYFLQDEHNSFIDTIPENDTACIFFVALGSGSVNVKDINNTGKVKLIYPQPAHNYLNIQIDEGQKPLQTWVTDIAGRTIMHNKQLKEKSTNTYQLDIANIPSGIYVLQLMFEDGQRQVSKFIVE